MFILFRYKKKGLPLSLIKLHEFLVEDIILYFEKGKFIKKRLKETRKTVKQALKFAQKRNVYPSKKTDQALELMEELLEEVEYTHKILKETAAEMENMITQIKKERVETILSMINTSRDHFRGHKFEKGVEFLKKAQSEMDKKFLLKTRENCFAGIDSPVKKIKNEIRQKVK